MAAKAAAKLKGCCCGTGAAELDSGEPSRWGEPPFGLYFTLTGHGLVHVALLAGLYQYVDTVEWKVLLLWSVPPLLHGWLHGANPLLWLLLSPKCLRAAGVAAAASGADAIPVRALGARVDTLDLCVTALQWASLLVGGLALFLTPVSGRPAASYAPTSALLAVAIVLPAWQLRTLTGRVVRRVEANEDLDARWRGMKVLAQLYSLWARFRLPLCLAQAAVLIAGHAFDARNTGLQAGLLAEVVLFALVTAAGYRFHRSCLSGLEELAPPPVQLQRHCALFGVLCCADLALKACEIYLLTTSNDHAYYADFDMPESFTWITLYASVMLNFYMLAITVLYLTYNRHILDDVLILVTTMGIYRSADGQAPVPEWMYSQISHPSTTILTPFIFNFCVLTLPTIVILGVHFFERLPKPQIEFFQEVLFIDLVVGLCAALLYFASFLAESLLGLAAVRRAVFINMMFAGAAASFRLWTPHQLTEDEGAAGKELSAYMLYSVLARNAFFWLVTTASFCAAMYACGTWLISSSLWVGLGARADYLNSPEPPAACKAVGRPAWRLCAAFAILMTWDMLLWVVCTTEDLCAARTGVALQVSLVLTLGVCVLMFAAVVVLRLWTPLRLGPLYLAEWSLLAAFLAALATGAQHIALAHVSEPAIAAQMYVLGFARVLMAAWLARDLRRHSWLAWRGELQGCVHAYLRARYAHCTVDDPSAASAVTAVSWESNSATAAAAAALGGGDAAAAAAAAAAAQPLLTIPHAHAMWQCSAALPSAVDVELGALQGGGGGGGGRLVRSINRSGEVVWRPAEEVMAAAAPAARVEPGEPLPVAAAAALEDGADAHGGGDSGSEQQRRLQFYSYAGPERDGGAAASSQLPSAAAARIVQSASGAWLRRLLPGGELEWVRGSDLKEDLADMQRLVETLKGGGGSGGGSGGGGGGGSGAASGAITADALGVVASLPFEAKRAWLRRQLRALSAADGGGGGGGGAAAAHAEVDAVPPLPARLPPGVATPATTGSNCSDRFDEEAQLQQRQAWQQSWHQPHAPRQSAGAATGQFWRLVPGAARGGGGGGGGGGADGGWPSARVMEVSRAALLESSARAFAAMDTAQLRRPLRIRFIGESAIDAGGVGREWFELVANALFEPALGLFAHAQTDHMTYTINPATAAGLAPFAAAARAFGTLQGAYRFAGRFLGKAMLEEKSLPVHLSRPLYKHLLGVPVTHRDLKFVDRKLAENLQWLRGHQNVEVLSLDFTTVEESGHAAKGRERYQVVELKPGGRDILVTDANKHEFCEISTKFKLLDRISPQLAAMLSGFYEVIPPGLLVVFDPQELELLLCGLDAIDVDDCAPLCGLDAIDVDAIDVDAIDVDDWAAHTALLGTLRPTHRLVRWFWDVVREFDQPTRARLLQFVTGTSRVPLGGFRELQGVDGEVRLFTLAALPAPAYGEGAYPVAHTCFNRLDLPPYGDRETLRAKLAEVIELELRTGFGKE